MKKQLFLCSLTGILAFALVYPHAARALAPRPRNGTEVGVGVCFGVMILFVGGGIIIGLKSMCDQLGPPKPSGHHTIPNPIAANMAARFQTSTTATNIFNFDESAASIYDISAIATNAAFRGPDGIPYQFYFHYGFRTSTNLSSWDTNYVSGYVSPTWTLTQIGTNAMLAPRGAVPVFGVPATGSAFFFQPLKPE